MIRWANGHDLEPAPQTKKASSSEEVRASALRLSSQMALSLRLQLRPPFFGGPTLAAPAHVGLKAKP